VASTKSANGQHHWLFDTVGLWRFKIGWSFYHLSSIWQTGWGYLMYISSFPYLTSPVDKLLVEFKCSQPHTTIQLHTTEKPRDVAHKKPHNVAKLSPECESMGHCPSKIFGMLHWNLYPFSSCRITVCIVNKWAFEPKKILPVASPLTPLGPGQKSPVCSAAKPCRGTGGRTPKSWSDCGKCTVNFDVFYFSLYFRR